jgi:hypothetical protein
MPLLIYKTDEERLRAKRKATATYLIKKGKKTADDFDDEWRSAEKPRNRKHPRTRAEKAAKIENEFIPLAIPQAEFIDENATEEDKIEAFPSKEMAMGFFRLFNRHIQSLDKDKAVFTAKGLADEECEEEQRERTELGQLILGAQDEMRAILNKTMMEYKRLEGRKWRLRRERREKKEADEAEAKSAPAPEVKPTKKPKAIVVKSLEEAKEFHRKQQARKVLPESDDESEDDTTECIDCGSPFMASFGEKVCDECQSLRNLNEDI